jgi:hypothetical protein
MRNVQDKSSIENQNIIVLPPIKFFRNSHRLWDNVEKYGGVRQATFGNTAHSLNIPDD